MLAAAVAVTGILIAAVTGPGRSAETVAGTWTMYQARSDHNAVFPRANFRERWTYDSGDRINGGLSVVGDTVFFDTLGGKVVALDIRNGNVRWQAKVDNVAMSTPIVAEGNVYIGTGHNGTIGDHHSNFVYAAEESGSTLQMWGRPEGDHVIAFDANTGEQRWMYRTAGEDMPTPVAINGILVFANGDFNAYGLRARDGSAAWQRSLRGLATMASANRAGDYAIVSTCSGPNYRGATMALQAATGNVRWSAAAGDCDSAPTVAGNRVLVSGVDGNRLSYGYGARGIVHALDVNSGRVLWRYVSPEAGPFSKIGSNERAIAGCYDGGTYFQALPTINKFLAFDAATGRVRWERRTAGPVKMSAVVRSGRVYFGDTVGLFYAVDATTGKILKVDMYEAPFTVSPPVIIGDTVLVVSGTKVFAAPL
jgi:outer membrane protein assembly factor BamB